MQLNRKLLEAYLSRPTLQGNFGTTVAKTLTYTSGKETSNTKLTILFKDAVVFISKFTRRPCKAEPNILSE